MTLIQKSDHHDSLYERQEFEFVDYAPYVFHKMRHYDGILPRAYLKSLLQSDEILSSLKFSEGRSGSFFCKTADKKFVIKSIPAEEAQVFFQRLKRYFYHLAKFPDSFLVRIYSLMSLQLEHGTKIYVVVMRNAFDTDLSISQRFDLKGSWVRRDSHVNFDKEPTKLGMDVDFARLQGKLILSSEDADKFHNQIKIDSSFLRDCGIIDYSLLVGIHKKYVSSMNFSDNFGLIETSDSLIELNEVKEQFEGDEKGKEDIVNCPPPFYKRWKGGIPSEDNSEVYFLQIIDIFQLFNMKKKMEKCFKVYLLRKEEKGLSVQSPEVYAQRFIEKMKGIAEDSASPINF